MGTHVRTHQGPNCTPLIKKQRQREDILTTNGTKESLKFFIGIAQHLICHKHFLGTCGSVVILEASVFSMPFVKLLSFLSFFLSTDLRHFFPGFPLFFLHYKQSKSVLTFLLRILQIGLSVYFKWVSAY